VKFISTRFLDRGRRLFAGFFLFFITFGMAVASFFLFALFCLIYNLPPFK
jgi:hypothetical protein